jgi:hypothetical protein
MIRIDYEVGRSIEFVENDINYFLGKNVELCDKILRTLKRFSNKKNLNEIEEIIYGREINIYKDEKKLKLKDIDLYIFETQNDIKKQFNFAKDTLIYNEINRYSDSYELNNRIEEINNALINFGIELDSLLKNNFTSFSTNISDITYQDIIKNFFEISFFNDDVEYTLEMIDINILISDYLKLLKNKILREHKYQWIVIKNPKSFLNDENMKKLIDGLLFIEREIGFVRIFIFSQNKCSYRYVAEDIQKLIILSDNVDQMPPYDVFVNTIEMNYPDEFCWEKEKLIESMFRIVEFIGKNEEDVYLKPKDMVLLNVVNVLLGYDRVCISDEEEYKLSKMERKYLL